MSKNSVKYYVKYLNGFIVHSNRLKTSIPQCSGGPITDLNRVRTVQIWLVSATSSVPFPCAVNCKVVNDLKSSTGM